MHQFTDGALRTESLLESDKHSIKLVDLLYRPADLSVGRALPLRSGAIVPINKPLGWTSFDIVNKFRIMVRQSTGLRRIKVGHAGTLDPQATGVLLLCTGRATKSIEQLMDHTKEYEATLKLGATTISFDKEFEENAHYPYEHITREMIESVLQQFEGEQLQQPPIFSAIQVNGVRAYDLARQGESMEMPMKRVQIYSLTLLDYTPPLLRIGISCSRGTYIRSLARDLGQALGSGAYLTELIRTRSGFVSLDDCFPHTQIEAVTLQSAPEEEGFEPLPIHTPSK